MPNVLISQDLSCYGQVSMTSALPLLYASQLKPTILPTALLSTHTGGFGENTYCDLAQEMLAIIQHWQKLNLQFDYVYLGYLGLRPLQVLQAQLDTLLSNQAVVLLDPVMGDHNHLYKGFDDTYVQAMRQLTKQATIITPNYTEAKFLLGETLVETTSSVTIADAKQVLTRLCDRFGLQSALITGLPLPDNQIGIVGLSPDQAQGFEIIQPKLAGNFFGTGDTFTTALLAGLTHQKSLRVAATMAAELVSRAIAHRPSETDTRLGIDYAPVMTDFLMRLDN